MYMYPEYDIDTHDLIRQPQVMRFHVNITPAFICSPQGTMLSPRHHHYDALPIFVYRRPKHHRPLPNLKAPINLKIFPNALPNIRPNVGDTSPKSLQYVCVFPCGTTRSL